MHGCEVDQRKDRQTTALAPQMPLSTAVGAVRLQLEAKRESVSTGDANEFLGFLARAEDRHPRNAAADHGDFVAAVQTRAGLAVFEYLVRQFGLVLDGAEAVLEEEVGDAREETDRLDAVRLCFFNESVENAAARALALGFGLDDDGTDLA